MNFLKIVTFFFNNFVIVSFGLYPKRDTDILPPCSVRILTVMLGKIGVEGATPPNWPWYIWTVFGEGSLSAILTFHITIVSN